MHALLSLTAALAAAAVPAPPEPPAKPAPSKVTAVTVYQSNALVTREVDVPEGVGTVEVVVADMPPQTLTSSLYAEGGDGVQVLTTRYRTRALREDNREEVRKLEQQLRELLLASQRLQSEIKTAEDNLKTLGKMESFTAATLQHMTDKGALNSEATINLAKYVMATRSERMKEVVTLQQQVAANAEQAEFLKRQLHEKAAGSSRTERDAVIVLDKKRPAAAKVRLNYLVSAATWRPQYKLRAGKAAEPVVVEYLAAVSQQTGEDWGGVKVVLSTAQPLLNAAPPELKALEVAVLPGVRSNPTASLQGGGGFGGQPGPGGYPVPPDYAGVPGMNSVEDLRALEKKSQSLRAQSSDNYNRRNPDDAGKQINEAAALEQWREVMVAKEAVSQPEQQARGEPACAGEGPSVTYHLPSRLTLPSRSDEQIIEVARLELKPEYYYKAVPVLTQHVYRLADLVNKSDYVLLPGEATTYQGTDFVGMTRLPLVAIGKQFTVGFGVDPQLQVSRQLVSKDRTTQGGNQVVKFDYRILVQSYKPEAVKVQVRDRLPHAEAQALAVTLVSQKPELSKDALYRRDEFAKNLLRWDVTVEPSMNGERALAIDYEFKLELDRQMHIGPFTAK